MLSIIPAAHAANANLFVSAENLQFNNYMSGPQIIEVVIIDSDINGTNVAKGEPDVTVNGKKLRMVQAVDGNWYGYFADRNMTLIADSTVTTPGTGLDYGEFCNSATTLDEGDGDSPMITVADTVGIIVPGTNGDDGGLLGAPIGGPITTACGALAVGTGFENNVIREAKALSILPNGVVGQIGVDETLWPFIQLYALNPTGNVVIQYNKGGGVQTTTLTFDTVDQFADVILDRVVYPNGTQVHVTITDLWLNIDPTDEDSWTFGTVGDISTNYQVFDDNGAAPGANFGNTDGNVLTGQLPNLMCQDNCVLKLNPDVQGQGFVVTLQDNKDTFITATFGGSDPDNPTNWETDGGFLSGDVPITITELNPNSGVFGTYDETDVSNIVILDGAKRGTSASIDYNDSPVTILVGYNFATIDIQSPTGEWNSGEEIPITLDDRDANKNSRVDEDLDIFNPNVTLIPSLRTGTPTTLFGLTAATLDSDSTTFIIENFSDRALLTTSTIATIADDDDLTLRFGNMANVFSSTPLNSPTFHGFALFNYDVRSLQNAGNLESITSVDITLPGIPTFTDQPLKGLILLPPSFGTVAPSTPLTANFNINIGAADTISIGTTLPIVADIFGFGFTNDGREDNERFANQIIRLELEETGDDTGTFAGTLEYRMINQLNILDPNTYSTLVPISDEASFIVIEDLTDEDSPRVNYLDLGADGVSTQVADQQAAPTHSGVATLNGNIFNIADTVIITLKDLDLNVDNDLVDIYTVVTIPNDANLDIVGTATVVNGGTSIALTTGDQLGRLLYVTFDGQPWKTPTTATCAADLVAAGVTDTGLGVTGFTLVETTVSSGVFTGDFQVPAAWCRPGATTLESVNDLDIEVNYVDFRDESGKIIDVQYDNTKKYQVKLDSGSFTPTLGFYIADIKGTLSTNETENFFFLQTTRFLDYDEIKNLEANGITLVDYLNNFVYVASVNNTSLDAFPFDSYNVFRSAIPINPLSKLDSNIQSKDIPPWANPTGNPDEAVVIVYFHKQFPADKMIRIVTDKGGRGASAIESISAVSALMSFDQITELSKHSAIKFIAYRDPPLEPEISGAKIAANITPIQVDGLTGDGINALIFDGATITNLSTSTLHPDLNGRIHPLNNDVDIERRNHAFHVAGVLGGGGIEDSNMKGVAPKVQILSWGSKSSEGATLWASVPGDLEDALQEANIILETLPATVRDRVDLMNISLGNKVNVNGWPCKDLGDYTTTSETLDKFVKGSSVNGKIYPKIIITKSAGNERYINLCTPHRDLPYEMEFGTINSPATAKNPIVVGSIDSKTKKISEFSGFGPTDDGRIKPDLVAPGAHNTVVPVGESYEGITSTDDTLNDYTSDWGTSIAAPIVGGLVALMEERWENKLDAEIIDTFEPNLFPHAAKAILIHTANDLGNPGPDYKFGWGLVNGKNAIKLITDSKLVNASKTTDIIEIDKFPTIIHDSLLSSESNTVSGKYREYSLKLNAQKHLNVTLVWDDFSGSVMQDTSPNLRNDLDLSLTDMNGIVIRLPFVLDKDDPNATATTGIDKLNNVEVITVDESSVDQYGNKIIEKLQNKDLKIIVRASTLLPVQGQHQVQDFTLIVSGTPQPVKLELNPISDKTVKAKDTLTFTATLTKSSTDVAFILESPSPSTGASINSNTGKFTWTPTESQVRSNPYFFDIVIKRGGIELDRETVKVRVDKGTCLIATAAFGSEMAPQVQFLREIRDNKIMSTATGASFMTEFNQFYYSFSPYVAEYERENPAFKELVKIGITPMLTSLLIMSTADSDLEVIGFGIGVILINIGMYLVLPIFAIIRIKKYFQK